MIAVFHMEQFRQVGGTGVKTFWMVAFTVTQTALLLNMVDMRAALKNLAQENQSLRDRNAVVERSNRLPRSGGVNYDAVRVAHYWTQIPPGLVAAIRLHENGPETGLELGYHGKSKFVVDHVPDPGQWQYVEAARLAERAAWAFCLDRREEYMNFLGHRYTGGLPKKYKAWGQSVDDLWHLEDMHPVQWRLVGKARVP